MADKMVYPIGFDLESAVKKASEDWESKYADKLEKAIQKRAININLKVSKLNFESLEEVKKRLAELKIEPITPETKAAIKELAGELMELAKALEAVKKYSARVGGTPEAVRNSKIEVNEQRAAAARELAHQRAAKAAEAELKLASARERAAKAADKAAGSVKNLSRAYESQSSLIERLIKKMIALYSINSVRNFITSIREVTAQFELQRVSLGAIIQDQQKANELFAEIKNFAIKSPLSIMDLTKYTKQVAAYGIETNKLFDTTKMLADISVGLGVGLERLSLFYGQVFATGYLRASEVRQATEAGIPLVAKLAEKLSQAKGELVSAADVMDMISKRAISFEMVEDVFKDMTSAGGMFYNMQEQQGNTLFGLWAKLGDAASLMYDEIGNTELINNGMKSSIELLTLLMKNWRLVGGEIGIITAAIAISTIRNKSHAKSVKLQESALNKVRSAGKRYNAILKEEATLSSIATASQKQSIAARKANAKAALDAAIAERDAANATNLWSRSWNNLKSVIMGNWVTIVIALVATIGNAIYNAVQEANKLKNELKDIEKEGETESARSVFNFERLANSALRAAEGSKAQKDALDELRRTYKDIIPVEQLTIHNLRRMKEEGYAPLTASIKEYIAQRTLQKEIEAISEHYTSDITSKQRELRRLFEQRSQFDFFRGLAWSPIEGLDSGQISQIFANVDRIAKDKSKSWQNVWIEAIKSVTNVSEKQEAKMRNLFDNKKQNGLQSAYNNKMRDIVENTRAMGDETETATKKLEKQTGALGRFLKAQENVDKALDNTRYTRGGKALDPDKDSYLLSQMQINAKIKAIAKEIQTNTDITDAMKQAGIGIKAEWFNIVENLNLNDLGNISLIDFDAIIDEVDKAIERLGETDPLLKNVLNQLKNTLRGWREEQRKMIPDEAVVKTWRGRWQAIAGSLRTSTDFMYEWLMKSGEDFETYRKRIKDEVDRILKQVKVLQNALQHQLNSELSGSNTKLSDEERKKKEQELAQLKKDQEALQQLYDELAQVDSESPNKKKKGGRAEQDKRFELLKNEFSMVKKLYDEYKKMAEVVGGDKAAVKLNELYGSTLKMLAKRHNISLPTTTDETTDSLDILLAKMKSLAGAKGNKGQLLFPNAQKEIEDFAMQVETLRVDEVRKNIEKRLKELADRISRTKTAKEFYEKILSQTGNIQLSAQISTAIYGDDGFELQKRLADQIRGYFQNENIKVDIPIDVIGENNSINYRRLGEFAEEMKEQLGEEPYKAIKKIVEDGQKDMAKAWEGYFKDIAKTEDYASKLSKLAQTTADKIAAIRRDMEANPELQDSGKELIAGLIDKEMKEAAQLEWDAFKGTPLYVQMFDDLEHASTSTLEMMRSRLAALSRTWGSALDPTQLKEMQSRMNEITEQLRTRNPWKELKVAYSQYKDATDSVTTYGAGKNADEASKDYLDASERYGANSVQAKAAKMELDARERIAKIVRQITKDQGKQVKGQKALTLAQQKAFDQAKIARGQLEIATAELIAAKEKAAKEKAGEENLATDPGVLAAQARVKAAEEEVKLTERVSEIVDESAKNSMSLKESMIAAANEVTQYMNMAGDLAHSIADVMEAVGADEEDVEYWNTVGDAMSDITAGVQDLMKSITEFNIPGIINSVITAIPKMFVGFVNLFSAGKVRKANKEIKRQQEVLEQLEYSYGRLEKAADKAFGGDYVSNINAQKKNLEAQIAAYEKQLAAENSKGKKKDKEKVKEYQETIRDTKDALAELEGQVAAQMLGTDLTSAARDFAKAWLDAYKEFGNTADAMSDKFHEMIENMVVESLLAKVMERALEPAFKMIDSYDGDFMDEEFWKRVSVLAEQGAKDADYGAQTMMKFLEQAGISMRDLGGDMTGISRDIASASEESINGLAQGINTQNFYISQIHANVAAIAASMGATSSTALPSTDYTPLIQQSLENQGMMIRYQAETLAECKAIAKECVDQTGMMRRVIFSDGGKQKVRVGY